MRRVWQLTRPPVACTSTQLRGAALTLSGQTHVACSCVASGTYQSAVCRQPVFAACFLDVYAFILSAAYADRSSCPRRGSPVHACVFVFY